MIDIALHTIIGTLAAIGAISTGLTIKDLRAARRQRRRGPQRVELRIYRR